MQLDNTPGTAVQRGRIQRKIYKGPYAGDDYTTSPYVHSRDDSSTFYHVHCATPMPESTFNPLPESTLSPESGTLDLASDVSLRIRTKWKTFIWYLRSGNNTQRSLGKNIIHHSVPIICIYLCRACLHSFFIDCQSTRGLRITSIPRDAAI